MSSRRQRLGQVGERLAAEALAARGYAILARNWRCPAGEIDIVARDGDTLVMVEVRTRRGEAFGTPEESVTPAKQARLVELGQTYVQERGWDGPWRIDVVAVQFSPAGRLERLTVIPNAVEG
ncbi:MAG: YraN family protein [Anaerolineae bacterium]|nr:YraN family protein [Anaerolineae bacterium]